MLSGCSDRGYGFFASQIDCLKQCTSSCDGWYTLYGSIVSEVSACTSADQCIDLRGTSCGCTRNLVVNKESDLTTFWEVFDTMTAAGCSIMITCDCPVADGFVCRNGHCAWNYLSVSRSKLPLGRKGTVLLYRLNLVLQ